MNARLYLRLLRPGRTLSVALLYGFFIWTWLHHLFGLPAPEARLFTLVLVGPAMLGSLLLGPLHEVMHRSFFPTLPGARQQLRRWHLLGISASALGLFVPAVIWVRDLHPAAALGLIAASLTLPALNRRRRTWGVVRPFYLWLIAAGILLAVGARAPLLGLCHQWPWAVLAGGLGVAYVCLRLGFSSRWVADRWHDPIFFCFQSVVPFFGGSIHLHAQTQARQFLLDRRHSHATSARWDLARVGDSLRDWRRVVHHARFGATTRLRQGISQSVAGAITTPIYLLVMYFILRIQDPTTTIATLCAQVAEAGAMGGPLAQPLIGMVFGMPPVFAGIMALSFALATFTPPQTFPLSRHRLAGCMFAETLRAAAKIWVGYAVVTAICFVGICLAAHLPLHPRYFLRPLAALLGGTPLVLAALALLIRSIFWRFWRVVAFVVSFIGLIIGIIVSTILAPQWFTPAGLLVWTLSTALGGWLCWRAFQHCYRTCDLLSLRLQMKLYGIA